MTRTARGRRTTRMARMARTTRTTRMTRMTRRAKRSRTTRTTRTTRMARTARTTRTTRMTRMTRMMGLLCADHTRAWRDYCRAACRKRELRLSTDFPSRMAIVAGAACTLRALLYWQPSLRCSFGRPRSPPGRWARLSERPLHHALRSISRAARGWWRLRAPAAVAYGTALGRRVAHLPLQ